jgi:hypothetical protein
MINKINQQIILDRENEQVFLSKYKRKKTQKKIQEWVKNKLFPYTQNNYISGYIVFLIHWIITLFVFSYIFIGNIDHLFYLASLIWFIIIGLHLYFNGCIFTKLERYLWNTNVWNGPWVLLTDFFSFNMLNFNKFSRFLQNLCYLIWTFIICITIFLKLK